jgi:hypothetical protein
VPVRLSVILSLQGRGDLSIEKIQFYSRRYIRPTVAIYSDHWRKC